MATLFNTKISQTYQGLLKTIDNAALSATLRELTDGSGNQSGLFLNKAGDFKVSAILEWGSLKDTGTGVTITQFVTAANGIQNFNNDTTVPTSAAVKLYVDTKFSTTDTLTEVLGFGNTTSGKDIAVSAGDDITFTDSSKILMGAGSDLQIYHDGANSKIADSGSGGLFINTDLFRVLNSGNNENIIRGTENASVELFYDNIKRIETTTAGAEVTGNLVVTGTITGSGGSFLPLAGGTMTGNIRLNDNVQLLVGSSTDLLLYHNGSNSYISNYTGDLFIEQAKDNGNINFKSDNGTGGTATYILINGTSGAVELSHYGSKKFETTSAGATVTGTLSTTSNVTVGANATFVDNGKAIFGAGSDLQIYHDGSNSYIADTGTGSLKILAQDFDLNVAANNASMIKAIDGGQVELYYGGSKKFETLTAGAKVTGNLEVTGTITGSGGSFLPLAGGTMTGDTTHNDNVKSIYGTSGDGLKIFHDGSDSFIRDLGTGNLLITSDGTSVQINKGTTENMAEFITDGAVKLYYDSSKKFETTNTGIAVTGNAALSTGFSIVDDQYGKFGNNDDLIIGHGGSSIVRNLSGDLYIDQFAVTQSIFFRVSNANAGDTTALTINREGDLITGADVTIAGDLTVNGTTTTINTQTLAVEDPLIELSKDNAANSVDIGFYGKYNDGTARYLGLFSDASDSNKFRLFKGTTVQPTTTVNIAGSGYVAADLELANLTGNGTILLQGSATQTIRLIDNTQGVTLSSFAQDSNAGFGTFSNHSLNIYSNSSVSLTLDTSQNATFVGNVFLPDNKYATFGGANNAWELQIGVVGDNAFIEKTATSNGDLYIKNNGSGKGIIFQNGGATALTIDSSQNAAFSGDVSLLDNKILKIGTANDLELYHNNSSVFSQIRNNTGDLYITNLADDKDIIFQGDDAGSVITALTLDMSAAGAATFGGELISANAGRYFKIQNAAGNANFPTYSFQNDGNTGMLSASSDSLGFITGGTTALTLDSAQNATFTGKITQSVNSGGTAASFTNADATNGYGLAIQSEGTANTRYALILRNINATVNYGGVSTMTNQVGFWGIGVSPTGTLGSRLTVQDNVSIGDTYTGTAAPSNGMIVQGNTGIGTASPDVSGAGSSSTVLSVIETVGNRRGILELGDNQNADTGGIGSINFVGTYQDAGHKIMAEIRASGSGTTSGQRGSFISMFTKENGTATITERMRITDSGNFGFNETTITNPYSQTNFTDLNIDGVWGGVISFKLGGTEKGWIGQRNSGNSDMVVGASAGQDLHFNTDGNNTRMLITSGGFVEIGPASNKIIINSQATFQSSTLNSHIINANGLGAYGSGDLLIQPRCSTVSPNKIVFFTSNQTNTPVERMSIKHNGEVNINNDAIIKGTKYSAYSTGGLDTTGVVVATVTGAGNGASSSVEFVGMGGVNGIVDVVYNCTNQGGNWYAYKNERQTAATVDVVVTGNGTTTLTFTFKAISSSQGYTPRLRMIGSPSATVFF